MPPIAGDAVIVLAAASQSLLCFLPRPMRRILYRQQVASLALCMPHALSPSRFSSLPLSLSVSLLGIFNFNARSLLSLCHLFSVPASPPLPPSLPAVLNIFWHALAMRLCVLPSFLQPCLTSPFSLSLLSLSLATVFIPLPAAVGFFCCKSAAALTEIYY